MLQPHVPAYLAHLADRGRSPATIRRYRDELNHYFAWSGERALTGATLNAYRLYLQREKIRQDGPRLGLEARTIRLCLTILFSFCAWLRRQKLAVPEDLPTRDMVEIPRAGKPQREVPTPQEVAALFAAADRMPANTARKCYLRGRARAILTLLRYTGLRRAELLGLNASDLEQRDDCWWVRVRYGKGGEPRRQPVADCARDILAEWLEVREAWAKAHQHTSDALLPVDRVRRLSDRGLTSIWDELLSGAGIQRRITPHGLRHTFASELAAHASVSTVQGLLGHGSVRTTELYLHQMPQHERDAVNRLSAPGQAHRPTRPHPQQSRRPRRRSARRGFRSK